jgi:hypothetical protein
VYFRHRGTRKAHRRAGLTVGRPHAYQWPQVIAVRHVEAQEYWPCEALRNPGQSCVFFLGIKFEQPAGNEDRLTATLRGTNNDDSSEIAARSELRGYAPRQLVPAPAPTARHPQVMTLRTLADVRELMRHLPAEHRNSRIWRYVAGQVERAAGGGDVGDAATALRIALILEKVECRPQ